MNPAERAVEQGLDATEDAVRCVVTDQACIDKAQQEGKEVVVTNTKGKPLPPDQQQPVQFALWVQAGRIRIYVNGNRVVDANQVALGTINYVDMDAGVDQEAGGFVGVRRARIAETAPDFSKAIMSGRYVTHGILFDVDSDRIKPESAATIRVIASGLQSSSGSNFVIEGHTDSTGARIATKGLGATRPVASNDTPQGRAENRRVEFVRQ